MTMLSVGMKDFFRKESIYSKAADDYCEQIKNISTVLDTHLLSFLHVIEYKKHILDVIGECKSKCKDFAASYEESVHYRVKVDSLNFEKKDKEKKGQSLSSKELEKLQRVLIA